MKRIRTSWGWAGPSSVTDLLVHLPLWWFPCGHLTLSLSSHKDNFLWVGPLVCPTSCEIVFLCGHLHVRSALIFFHFWPFFSSGAGVKKWKKEVMFLLYFFTCPGGGGGGRLCKMKFRLTPSSSTEAGFGLSLAISKSIHL